MTKKDYIVIADTIKKLKGWNALNVEFITKLFIESLAKDNPKFSSTKFKEYIEKNN